MIDLSVPSSWSVLKDPLSMLKGNILGDYHGSDVMCEHPRIIANPVLAELVYRYGNIHTPVGVRRFRRRAAVYHIPETFRVTPNKRNVTYDNYKDYFVLDETTGERFPVFMLVPCNHCNICRKSKIDAYAHRCVLETMCYNSFPWFVTLTYRNECLPKHGVSKLDHQLFMKRFRTNLDRAGYFDDIRFVVCAEYSPVGRPHYHYIFWNLHPCKGFPYGRLFKILEHSWNKGFVYNELVSPNRRSVNGKKVGSPQKCFEYVAKYIGKGSNVPDGMEDTFRCDSRHNGGIGSPFLDKYVIPDVRKTLNPKFEFLDIFSPGHTQRLFFNRYVLNRCFPTFSQSVPLDLRKAWKDLLRNMSYLKDYRHGDFVRLYQTLSKFLPSPVIPPSEHLDGPPCLSHCGFLRWSVDRDIEIIDSIFPRIDLYASKELDRKRKLFVGKLLMSHKPRDIFALAYRAKLSLEKTDSMVYLPM